MNILIKNAKIITMNEQQKEIENGYIGICNDKISFVSDTLDNAFKADYTINASNMVCMPGFVNTHSHLPMTLIRGYSDGYPLHKWLFEKIFPIEEKLNSDSIYWGSMLSLAEMIMSGTTSFADMYFFVDDIAKAVSKSGLRANLSRGMLDLFIEDDFDKNQKVLETKELILNWHNKGLIKIDVSAHSPYTSSKSFLQKTAELAMQYDLGMHIHISETEKENLDIFENYKKTPTEFLNDLGYFKTRTIAAHCVYLSDNDMEILKKNNVFIAHNPTSNLKLGSGIAPIKKYLDYGINVSIGTDGASSNNNLDMLEEINLASLLILGTNKDPSCICSYDALKMATVNGARAMGYDNCGIIKEGYLADIILFNTDSPKYYPQHNMANNICYSGSSSDIDTVIVNGKILMEKRELKTLDFEEIKFNVSRVCKELFK